MAWFIVRAGVRTVVGLVVAVVALLTGGCDVGDDFTQESADRIQIDVLTTAVGTVEKFA